MIRVAIVEDHPALAEGLSALLSDAPDVTVVGAANDVGSARQLITKAAPDIVLCDIRLANGDGLELIEQLKADAGLRRVPIMAVTAYAAKGDEDRIRAAGAEAYVSKPISVMKFIGTVNGLVEETA